MVFTVKIRKNYSSADTFLKHAESLYRTYHLFVSITRESYVGSDSSIYVGYVSRPIHAFLC